MKKLSIMAVLAASLVAASSAEAGLLPGRCVGRHLGLGWGDGYHARCDCDHSHALFGCRLLDHGNYGKSKTSKCPAPGAPVYPAEEMVVPDEVPTPAMQP
jgi:hypothetical protein